ncbi:hypothetical protein D3C77_576560 [compost metagenome]
MTVTDIVRDILTRTLWGEARGESLAKQIAVVWTIRNRVNDGRAKKAMLVCARSHTNSAAEITILSGVSLAAFTSNAWISATATRTSGRIRPVS